MVNTIEFLIHKIIASYHPYFKSYDINSLTDFMIEYENHDSNQHRVSFHHGMGSVVKMVKRVFNSNYVSIKSINIQEGLFLAPIKLTPKYEDFCSYSKDQIHHINNYPVFYHLKYIIPSSMINEVTLKASSLQNVINIYNKSCKQNKNLAFYYDRNYYPFTTLSELKKEIEMAKIMMM